MVYEFLRQAQALLRPGSKRTSAEALAVQLDELSGLFFQCHRFKELLKFPLCHTYLHRTLPLGVLFGDPAQRVVEQIEGFIR